MKMTISEMNHSIAEVVAADDRRYQAMLAGDLVTLGQLLSPQLSYTHSTGKQDNKDEYLASMSHGTVKYLDLKRHEASVQIHGQVAVMSGLMQLTAIVDAVRRVLDNRFLSVWVHDDGVWRMVAWASIPTVVLK